MTLAYYSRKYYIKFKIKPRLGIAKAGERSGVDVDFDAAGGDKVALVAAY